MKENKIKRFMELSTGKMIMTVIISMVILFIFYYVGFLSFPKNITYSVLGISASYMISCVIMQIGEDKIKNKLLEEGRR